MSIYKYYITKYLSVLMGLFILAISLYLYTQVFKMLFEKLPKGVSRENFAIGVGLVISTILAIVSLIPMITGFYIKKSSKNIVVNLIFMVNILLTIIVVKYIFLY